MTYDNENHIVVDLETADNLPGAAILSIGAYVFTGPQKGDKYYCGVDMQSSLAAGLTMSDSTMVWWGKQSEQARKVFTDPRRVTLAVALYDFAMFLSRYSDARVWGNGASFDNATLQIAYSRTGQPLPWKYWNDRCYRTAVAGLPWRDQQGTHHNALDDAISQADHLLAVAPGAIK